MLFISGKMRGVQDFNFPAFHRAAKELREAGYEVYDPAEEDVKDGFDPYHCKRASKTRIERAQRRDIRFILGKRCTGVAVLDGIAWTDSPGACREIAYATFMCRPAVPVKHVCEWVIEAQNRKDVREGSVLAEAESLVHGDRNADYGHPADDYAKTGHIMGAILMNWAKVAAEKNVPVAVPARLACLCMQAVKLSREIHAHKRDNCTDGAGYWDCVQRIAEKEKRDAT